MLRWTVHLKGDENRCRCGAAVAVGNELYCFGPGGRKHDDMTVPTENKTRKHPLYVNVFNTVSLLWKDLPPGGGQCPLEVPSWRRNHTVVLVGETVYLWGGSIGKGFGNGFYCNELYAFDVDAHTWSKPRVSGSVPEGRRGHSACVLGKVMFIHGGYNEDDYCTDDIYKLDTSTMVWTLVNTGVWTLVNTRHTAPHATYGHCATIIGTKLFVCGVDANHLRPTIIIRVFDTETNAWLERPSTQPLPEQRSSPSAFTYNGELYIFGDGWFRGVLFNDLWKFNPETFSWKEVEPKGRNGLLRMSDRCCCVVGDRIILFGGFSGGLFVLDFRPSLKTLCKLAVSQYGLEQSGLPHNVRWELAAATSKS